MDMLKSKFRGVRMGWHIRFPMPWLTRSLNSNFDSQRVEQRNELSGFLRFSPPPPFPQPASQPLWMHAIYTLHTLKQHKTSTGVWGSGVFLFFLDKKRKLTLYVYLRTLPASHLHCTVVNAPPFLGEGGGKEPHTHSNQPLIESVSPPFLTSHAPKIHCAYRYHIE